MRTKKESCSNENGYDNKIDGNKNNVIGKITARKKKILYPMCEKLRKCSSNENKFDRNKIINSDAVEII